MGLLVTGLITLELAAGKEVVDRIIDRIMPRGSKAQEIKDDFTVRTREGNAVWPTVNEDGAMAYPSAKVVFSAAGLVLSIYFL